MPIKTNKSMLKSTCKNCGWTGITPQRSDVMIVPQSCKNCGGLHFERQLQSPIAALICNPLTVLARSANK